MKEYNGFPYTFPGQQPSPANPDSNFTFHNDGYAQTPSTVSVVPVLYGPCQSAVSKELDNLPSVDPTHDLHFPFEMYVFISILCYPVVIIDMASQLVPMLAPVHHHSTSGRALYQTAADSFSTMTNPVKMIFSTMFS